MGYLCEACNQISDFCHQCDEKCAYMFNVYKNQLSRQTGSKNATHNMVYLYDACDQISDFCHQHLLRKMQRKISWTDGRTEGWTDGQTDRGKTVYPPPPSGSGGITRKLSMTAMFVNRSKRNEQFPKRTFHRCFLPSFGLFGQVVSE